MNRHTLGDLESAVMDHFWTCGESDVKSVHACLHHRHITLNTVQSTIKRLHDKGMLGRRKVSHAYLYSAAVTRAEHRREALQQVVDEVADGQPQLLLAAFVDLAAESGDAELERLERMISERRRALAGDAADRAPAANGQAAGAESAA